MIMRFFRFITCFIITGAKSELVEVKPGDPVKLNLGTPLDDISRLTVQKDGTDVLFRYCSSEEKRGGCTDVNVTRFSLESGEIGAYLTCPDADRSDEGAYEVEVIEQNNTPRSRVFNITIIEHLPYVRPTSPFIHSSPPPDVPKNKTTTAVNRSIIIGVPVSTVVLMLVFTGVYFIYQRCKKKKQKCQNIYAGKENSPGDSWSWRAGDSFPLSHH
ncbi:uncharacterized protein LOC130217795 [Danio aesculapii]|uniref:uncharacterized protein LOC130217795 n=1 Tax=Danio aesculapii TaxID=1142201 RepID=UPI0024C0A276|nr:uncharacterized protein LOC130217795 [Danio aesculapii]